MTIGPTYLILLSDSDIAILVAFIFIFGVTPIVILLCCLATSSERAKHKTERYEIAVRSHSKLLKEVAALNNGKRSIRGKVFFYSKTGYVFLRTQNEWLSYSASDYLRGHKADFQKDLLNLQLFIDDCTIYQECADKLRKKFAADPDSIQRAQVDKDTFTEIEERLFREMLLPIPDEPHLEYDITLECGYQKQKRHIIISQSEVEAFFSRPKPVEIQTAAPEAEAQGNEPETTNLAPEINSDESPEQDAEPSVKEEVTESALTDEPPSEEETDNLVDSTATDSLATEEMAAPFLNEALELRLSSADETKPEQELNGPSEEVLPDDLETDTSNNPAVPVIPTIEDAKASALGAGHESCSASTDEPKPEQEIDVASDDASSTAPNTNGLSDSTAAEAPIHRDAEIPTLNEATSNSADGPMTIQGTDDQLAETPTATGNGDCPSDSVITEPQIVEETPIPVLDEAFERYFNSIDDLDREDYFWARLSDDDRLSIKYVAKTVFDSRIDLLPANQVATFGFRKRGVQSGHQPLLFWFRKPHDAELSFSFRKGDDAFRCESIPAPLANSRAIQSVLLKLLDGLSEPHQEIPAPEPTPVPEQNTDIALPIDNLSDPKRFFYQCTTDEKDTIIRIANLSLSLEKTITFGNTTGYFGFKKKWGKGVATQYWYWFKKLAGKGLTFSYRETQDSTSVKHFLIAEDKMRIEEAESIVRRLLTKGAVEEPKPPSPEPRKPASQERVPEPVPNGIGMSNPNYFLAKLGNEEKAIVIKTIRYIEEHWKDYRPENTKNFLGYRKERKSSTPFRFWFSKPNGGSLQFTYHEKPDDPHKNGLVLWGDSIDPIIGILNRLLSDALPNPRSQKTKRASEEKPAPTRTKPNPDTGFWESPFLYTSEIMRECGMTEIVPSGDIAAICTLHHFTYGAGVAFNNRYRSLADAIYQSKAMNSPGNIYIYSNPYNCQAYDRAIQKLLDELKLFDLGEGKYLTARGLQDDYGISSADCQDLRDKMKMYFQDNHFFTLDMVRSYCAGCRFLEFRAGDRVLMQFVHSIFGRGVKTIVTDQDSTKAVFSTELGEIEVRKFFVYVMDNANAMDIYAIKDRVESLFAVNYSLDLIGKDADRAGFFYSEDLEKVYKNKRYFYKEIQG